MKIKITAKPTRNSKLLCEFIEYCALHPKERFWQALRNWSGADKIYIERFEKQIDDYVAEDTFFWEKKNK